MLYLPPHAPSLWSCHFVGSFLRPWYGWFWHHTGVLSPTPCTGLEATDFAFAVVTALSFAFGLVIFAVFMWYVRRRGLFFIPDAASVLRTAAT